jgi:hypothetical protein
VIIVAAVAVALLTVPLLGGRLDRVTRLRLRLVGLIVAGLALQVLVISVLPATLPGPVADGLELVSYALAMVFLWANRALPWLWLVALGGTANLVAISANHGVMPASARALAAAGRTLPPGTFHNSDALAGAHLRFLGDIFALRRGWPLANVFSVGDVILVVGAALLIHTVCASRPARAATRWRGRSGVSAAPA